MSSTTRRLTRLNTNLIHATHHLRATAQLNDLNTQHQQALKQVRLNQRRQRDGQLKLNTIAQIGTLVLSPDATPRSARFEVLNAYVDVQSGLVRLYRDMTGAKPPATLRRDGDEDESGDVDNARWVRNEREASGRFVRAWEAGRVPGARQLVQYFRVECERIFGIGGSLNMTMEGLVTMVSECTKGW